MQQKILERVKKAVCSQEPSAEIILYGSRARKDNTDASDWDFLVLVDGSVDDPRTDRIRHAIYEVEWDTGEVLSSIIRSRGEWESPQAQIIPLYKNIRLEGVPL
jgi:predicted nucleotidyltransferase